MDERELHARMCLRINMWAKWYSRVKQIYVHSLGINGE